MKLVTFTQRGERRIGALGARNFVVDLRRASPDFPNDMLQFLDAGTSARALAQQIIAQADAHALIALDDVTWNAPSPNPGKLICVGHNYADHASIAGKAAEYPTCFGKFNNAIIRHRQPIVYPNFAIQLDYEAELAVVIGRRAKNVDAVTALDYVAGYTIFNDVTARDYQPHASQWALRKSFDTFGPMGPALVTADEIPDPGHLDVRLTLNGVERQRSNTCHLIFPVPSLIEYLTRPMTLEPGGVIATGTPSGTGASLKPPVFMHPGDEVRIHFEKIGELLHPIAASAA